MDFVNPNNILIEQAKKQINIIDPIGPLENKYVFKIDETLPIIGADSLYFPLTDLCLHKEHINFYIQVDIGNLQVS